MWLEYLRDRLRALGLVRGRQGETGGIGTIMEKI